MSTTAGLQRAAWSSMSLYCRFRLGHCNGQIRAIKYRLDFGQISPKSILISHLIPRLFSRWINEGCIWITHFQPAWWITPVRLWITNAGRLVEHEPFFRCATLCQLSVIWWPQSSAARPAGVLGAAPLATGRT